MNRVAIICVDDEEIILSSLEKQLKRGLSQDYDIELASSGNAALLLCAELEAEGIDIAVVISDQIMPGMSGDEFLIRLHAIYPKTLKILLTGHAGADSVGNIVNAAALYRYVSKPWDETDLILTVKEALRRYEQEQQLTKQNIVLKQTSKLLKQSNHKVSQSLKLLLAIFEATGDGILVLDDRDEVIIFNQKFAALWQIKPSVIEGNSQYILGLISTRLTEPNIFKIIFNQTFDSSKKELLKLNNGTILESFFQTQKLEGKLVGRVWGFRDVTVREREKTLFKHKSQHDTVTELPKRNILTCQLSEAIASAQKNSHLLAVMFVGLERFKVINDTLGHQAGDLLLKQFVKRLKDCLREDNNVIARWGNNEFTLLLPKVHDLDEVSAVAEQILTALKSPFSIENQFFYITTSIGIATYPEHGTDAETLLKNADTAVSQAQKLSRHNYQYYDSTFSSKTHKLLTLDNLLHSALAKKEFVLYYQPIVDLQTNKIAKMEALLRWQNPQFGLISPSIFIPLAEENGSIVAIGEWVLETACAQNKVWQKMGLDPVKISVNLSVRQFQQQNLVCAIANILKQTQLNPKYLELEITESITMQNTESTKAILAQLNKMGVFLSMDDFGTGYSSLSYLKQFPFHTLKIDRAFVKDLHCNSQDLAIVKAVIALGKGLNLNIVAEGVETEELRDLLKNLGCEYIQGYLYSKPVPAADATKLLRQHYFN